jgi:hypothetical protein
MSNYELEIKNRLGAKVLNKMKEDFKKGFHIVGFDEKTYTVGDSEKNISYHRLTGRVVSRCNLVQKKKLSRKAF